MSIGEYIKDKWASICIEVLTCILTTVFLIFMEVEIPAVAVVEAIFVLGVLGQFFYDCVQKKRYYDELAETWNDLEEKSYLCEVIDPPYFYDGKLMYQIIKQSGKYLNDVIAAQHKEMLDYKEYIQTWAHEIKTPIAVQELIIENNRNPVTSSLEEEAHKITAYVEQMMYYTKSGSLESDYIIQPVGLKKLVMEVIRKHSKMMVGAGVIPKLENLDYEVLTDPKWMEFILGQIVMNSVKYCDPKKKPYILFRAVMEDKSIILSIADNGIGIPKGDISRVFRKGFTGENGRVYKKSTGMGLYLCKDLCEKMQVPLEISSTQGEGTKLSLRLKMWDGDAGQQ